ncbi:MAG: DNA modification methylase [Nocardioides sp.]
MTIWQGAGYGCVFLTYKGAQLAKNATKSLKTLDDLTADRANANRGTERGRKLVAKSLADLGAGRSIVADAGGQVICGNKTLEAARSAGIPVRVVETDGSELVVVQRTDLDLSDPIGKARRLAYADNRAGQLGLDWDAQQIAADVEAGLDVCDLGFDEKQLREILGDAARDGNTDPDAVPEQRATSIKRGDMFTLGEHRLLCGDSTAPADVARLFGDDRASIIVTDPPYGVSYAAKNEFLNAIAPGNRIQTPIEGDHQTPEQMSTFWIAAFTAVREALAPGAAYYVTGPQGGDLLLLLLALRQSGFPLRHMLVWVKNNHVLGRCDYHYKHEPIAYGWVDGSHRFYGDASQFSTWEIDKPQKSDLHPTMKPVELYLRALSNSSQALDVVAEPFCGSGTSLIACEQLNRRCRAIEIDPSYCQVAIDRWEQFSGKKAEQIDG